MIESQHIRAYSRHLERRPPVSGFERCPGCHPERSEGSLRPASRPFAALRVTDLISKCLCIQGCYIFSKSVILQITNAPGGAGDIYWNILKY